MCFGGVRNYWYCWDWWEIGNVIWVVGFDGLDVSGGN